MIPAWATVFIAIAGSAVGGLLGALLQTSHERSESIRERMLAAADEFAAGLGHALIGAHDLAEKAEEALYMNGSLERASDALSDTRRRLGDVEAHAARVDLLFGANSPAGEAASKALSCLRAWIADYEEWPPREQAAKALPDADDAYYRFNTAARESVEAYGRIFDRSRSYLAQRRHRR